MLGHGRLLLYVLWISLALEGYVCLAGGPRDDDGDDDDDEKEVPPKSIPSIDADGPADPQHRQPPRHAQTIPQHVELGALDLSPADGDLYDGDPGKLGQHQHLDVEDPALAVHVGDDVGQGGAREELESALGIADGGGAGRRHPLEEEVEGMHEEVAQLGAAHHGFGADEVGARPDRHGSLAIAAAAAAVAVSAAAVAAVALEPLAGGEESAQIIELAGSVGVGEDDVLAAGVAHAVGHGTALAAVLREGD